jgi:hypothetical protein
MARLPRRRSSHCGLRNVTLHPGTTVRPVHAVAPSRACERWAPTSLQSSHGSSFQAPVTAWRVPTRLQPAPIDPLEGRPLLARVIWQLLRFVVLDQRRPGALLSLEELGRG